ncbi:O-antigen ligase family protein [Pseudomonas indica]|uniref:O-antigen ligase family protein n=1 Tax=Pseudomonas indica TaxID=137658 RepID=UPI000BAB60D4|nr:O-antigen ligase family protein [Pseudomonas indica]PAU56305.1 hypothetical protein BZL42_17570 [Pseudomonas indica]
MPLICQRRLATWASAGLVLLLCAPWILSSNKLYHQMISVLLWLPAVLFVVCRRELPTGLKSPDMVIFLLFSAWTLLVIAVAGGDLGKAKLPFYVGLTLLAITFIAQAGRGHLTSLLFWSSVAGGWGAALSWAVFYGVQEHAWSDRVIALGVWDTPIMAAHAAGALALLGLCLAPVRSSGPAMAAMLVAAIGYLLFLGFGQTRGVWVALAASLLVTAALSRSRLILAGVVVMALGMAGVWLVWPDVLLERSLSYRPTLWSGGVRLMEEHWLFGMGFNEFHIPVEELRRTFKHPHNLFLNVAMRLGVVGLLLWLALWAAIGWRALRHYRGEMGRALIALWVFSGVAFLTDGFGPWLKPSADWLLTWLPLGLSLVLAGGPAEDSARPGQRGWSNTGFM